MPPKLTSKSHWLARYAAALAAVGVGLLLRLGLTTLVGQGLPAYITFYPFILVVALFGGFGPGLLATLTSALAVDYWLLAPTRSFGIGNPIDAVGLVIFTCTGVFISTVLELYRRSRHKAAAYEAQAALRESEGFTQAILDSLPAHVAVVDERGIVSAVNESWREFARRNGGEQADRVSVGADYVGVCRRAAAAAEPLAREALEGIEGVLAGRRPEFTLEYPCHSPTQQRWFFMSVIRPIGGIRGAVVMHLDVSERKRAGEELRRSEERLKFALETSHTGAWELNLGDHSAQRSLEHDRIFGYAELLPQWTYEMFLEHVLPEDRSMVNDRFRRAVETGVDWNFECRIRRADQQVRWIWAAGRHRSDASGKRSGMTGIVQDITERKRAEEVLRESEQQFRTLADSIPNLAWWANADGYINWYNRRWYEYTGTTSQQMEGWGWQSVHDPQILPTVIEHWKASLATGQPFDMTFPLRGADGVFRPFLTRVIPLKDTQGRVRQWFGTNTDVSEQKLAEEANARLAAIVESSEDAIISKDLAENITSWNVGAQRLFGYTAKEIIGRSIRLLLPSERQDEEEQLMACLEAGQRVAHCETIRLTKEGQRVPVSVTASPLKNSDGRIIGASKILRDDKLRKQAEAAMQQLNAELRQRLADLQVANEEVQASRRAALSLAEDAYEARTEAERINADLQKAVDTLAGSRRAAFNLMDDAIRARKRAEQVSAELRQSEERYRSLIELSPEGLFVNRDDRIALVNPAALRLFGASSAEQLLGKSPFDIFHPDCHSMMRERIGALMAGQRVPLLEEKIVRLDGVVVDVEVVASPVFDQGQRAILVLLRDITERKRVEAALQKTTEDLKRSNRDLEQFAYVASHDLQEPLRAVGGYVKLLQLRFPDKLDAKARGYINGAFDGATRMERLITDLLAFSRIGSRGDAFQPSALEDALGQALLNLETSIKSAQAIVALDPLPTLVVDAGQIRQLFQNLIGNAIKFHGEQPPKIHIAAKRQDGRWVFSVRDNGIGIEPKYFGKIFQIFQRLHTRNYYPGTGIGLAICKRIVERHGGAIWVESQPGQGSTFYFSLSDKAADTGLVEPG